NQIATEETDITDLKAMLGRAQQQIKDETAAIRQNTEPTGTPRKVLINNYTSQYIALIINGYPRMPIIPPGQTQYFVIEQKINPTVITAYGDEDAVSWGPRYIWCQFTTYTWNLN